MSVESCSSFRACDMEEVCSESLRKMKDMEETTSEASWTAVTIGKEKEVRRLEPEGGAEKPQTVGQWSGVKGVSVNPEGENQTTMEEEVNGKAPLDEGAEVQSPKRKVIRVESDH